MRQAITVAEFEYFDIDRESHNECRGLMIGTAVRRISEPVSIPSKYNRGKDYWSVKVECPNGEIKTVGCDALKARKTDIANIMWKYRKLKLKAIKT